MPIARKVWSRLMPRWVGDSLLPLNEKRVEWGTLKIFSAASYTARRSLCGPPATNKTLSSQRQLRQKRSPKHNEWDDKSNSTCFRKIATNYCGLCRNVIRSFL